MNMKMAIDLAWLYLIKIYLWAEFCFDWIFSRWDKWIHLAVLYILAAISMNINLPALAIAGAFLAVGYALGWFIAKVKN